MTKLFPSATQLDLRVPKLTFAGSEIMLSFQFTLNCVYMCGFYPTSCQSLEMFLFFGLELLEFPQPAMLSGMGRRILGIVESPQQTHCQGLLLLLYHRLKNDDPSLAHPYSATRNELGFFFKPN